MNEGKINNPRAEIDAIDSELLRLLNRRAEIALRVGAVKTSDDTSLCDPNREREVLSRLSKENPGPFDEKGIANIFQRIIDESLHLQQKTYHKPLENSGRTTAETALLAGKSRVAFLGERGTFSEEAALGILGEDCQTVSFPTFEDLFRAIDEGKADYILTPLENSLVGSVHRCYDLLLKSQLNIIAEIILPISHFLIACPEASFETVQTVESHPAALAQCERFFAAHPNLRGVAADDTAGSVRRAVESGDITRAAIGGKRTTEIYGGKILREHIEDHSENYTRFALLSLNSNDAETGTKISLVLRLRHQPGALHNALRVFVRRGIDLLKIESRPIKDSPSQFYFYLDLRPPASEGELRGALDDIREQAEDVRYLGRYPTIQLTEHHDTNS
ncbi:MAG: prephenate dehydratase [Acidobacteriota bacterium]|nr:prephenate dehydratase [Acidobacteriota bacterium]